MKYLYENWIFVQIGKVVFLEKDLFIFGGMFVVWNDYVGNGILIKDIYYCVYLVLQILVVKMWIGKDVFVLYVDFDK